MMSLLRNWIFLILLLVLSSQSLFSQRLLDLSRTLDSLIILESKESLAMAKKLEKLSKKESSDEYLSKSYAGFAKIYFQKESYSKAIKYFEKDLKIRSKNSFTEDVSEAYYNLGSTCLKLKKYKKAKTYYFESLNHAKKMDSEDLIRANYNALVIVSDKALDHKNSALYMRKLFELNQGVFDNQIDLYKKQVVKQKQLVRYKTKELDHTKRILDTAKVELVESAETINYLEEDTLRKQMKISSLNFQKLLKDMELDSKNTELESEKRFVFVLTLGISSIAFLAIVVFFLLLSKRKMNKKLRVQTEKIQKQKDSITQSIQYASKIQHAALPNEELFTENFVDHFIIFEPRDIVSGDFYFIQKVNNYTIFSAVDCTGHGVPGAFMSMLGIAFLNEIIRKKEVTKASQILDLLRDEVKNSLKQKGIRGEQKDGMDMAICVINNDTNELQYSGAHNPLLLIRSGEMTEIKADRMPVGIHRKEKPFTNHIVQLQKNDKLYIYSDGFPDQIGGKLKKKYKTKAFRAFLHKNSEYSLPEQKKSIEEEFTRWKSDLNQIDDIVIIGIQI